VTFVDEDRRRARILYVEALGSEALNRRRIATGHELVAAVEQYAVERHGPPPPGEQIGRIGAAILVGGMAELVVAWLDGRIPVERDQLVDDATALFLAMADEGVRVAARRRRGRRAAARARRWGAAAPHRWSRAVVPARAAAGAGLGCVLVGGRQVDHLGQAALARGLGAAGLVGAREPLGDALVAPVGRPVLHRPVVRRRRLDLVVDLHAGAGRDELADDDVLLQTVEVVGAALDGGLGEHPGRLLERRRRQPRVGGQRRLGDAHDHGTALGRDLGLLHEALVLVGVDLGVHRLAGQEAAVARLLHDDPPGHLPDDQLDVLVVDRDALVAVHLLHLLDQVLLRL